MAAAYRAAREVFFIIMLGVMYIVDAKKCNKGTAKMHFYMHDNPTVVVAARPSNSTNQFGLLVVIDDKLTEGPSIDSKLVGRAQGSYMADSLSRFSLLMTFTAVFDNGSISFHGQDAIYDTTREVAVIGGTGDFRFSSGYAIIRTYSFVGTSAVLSFDVHLKQHC